MAKAKSRELLENAQFLKNLGYKVPEVLIDLMQKKEWERLGVKQVWKCKKCLVTLEQEVRLSGSWCAKGHTMEIVWDSGLS